MAKRKGAPARWSASPEERDAALIMSPARHFFIDHFMFLQQSSYRRLLAWVIEPYLHRVGRLQLTFMCSGGCCELDDRSTTIRFLLSGKHADAWVREG